MKKIYELKATQVPVYAPTTQQYATPTQVPVYYYPGYGYYVYPYGMENILGFMLFFMLLGFTMLMPILMFKYMAKVIE